jgi:hypothetical protein
MTTAIESDPTPTTEATYEVVFCAPGEALGAGRAQWFIEGCYSRFEEAQRAAHALIAATSEQLHAVTILHAQFDQQRGAFRERVVWSQDRAIALLSRINLQPLEADARENIVAHCEGMVRDAASRRSTLMAPESAGPSPLMVGLASTLTAAFCALGVLLVLV